MKIHKIECPNCHAQLDPIEGLDTFWCPYCRGKVIVDELSDKYYDTKVRFGEMEHEERMKDKATEYDLQKQKQEDKTYLITVLSSLLLLIFMLILIFFI